MNWTRFVVCAVFGVPSSLISRSQLPWSAVMRQRAAEREDFFHHALQARIDRLDRLDARPRRTPVWPTMSGLA